MKSPLTNVYWKADQFLVDRANEAVKFWNWTTGGTRAGLADFLNVGASALKFSDNLTSGVASLFYAFGVNRMNRAKDYLEAEASEVVDRGVKTAETIHKIMGPANLFFGTTLIFGEKDSTSSYDGRVIGIGNLLQSLGNYVMRADYQKPRKNCVRRGLEHLSSAIKYREPIKATTGPGRSYNRREK